MITDFYFYEADHKLWSYLSIFPYSQRIAGARAIVYEAYQRLQYDRYRYDYYLNLPSFKGPRVKNQTNRYVSQS